MTRFCFIIFVLFILNSFLLASDWQRLHGKYATIEYNPGFETLADSLLTIADNAIPRLSALHGLPLSDFSDDKARIILTDAPDISNGYAIADAIVIFARSSMYMENWSGPHTWYKQVLEHELVHHLTFRAIARKSSVFGLITSASVPRWFMEGIAQYYAETWTTFRGDIYMKDAVLNGRFNYDALNNPENGRLLYAAGHAYVRYLADQYGDSSIIKLVRYKKDSWFYDFNEAFNAVYGKSPSALFPFFNRHLIIYYGNRAADYPVINFTQTLPSFGYRDLQIIPLSEADSTYLVSTVLRENHLYKSAFIARIKNGQPKVIENITRDFTTRLFISPDRQKIAFGRFDYGVAFNQSTLDYDWYVYDRLTDSETLIAKNIRARNAVFDVKNNLCLVMTQADTSVIRSYNIQNKFTRDILKTEMPIGEVVIDSSNHLIFEGQLANSQRDFFKWDNSQIINLTEDSLENRNPVLISEKLIAGNVIIKNNPAIAFLDLKTGKNNIKINPQTALWLQGYDDINHTLIVTSQEASGKNIFAQIPVDTLFKTDFIPQSIDSKPQYASWINRQAKADSLETLNAPENYNQTENYSFPQGDLINLQTIPFAFYDKDNGTGLFLTTTWLEAMQRQVFNLNAFVYLNNWRDSFLSAAHWLKIWDIDLQTFYYHGPVIFTRIDGESIDLTHDYGQFGVIYKRYITGNPRLPYQASAFYTLDAVENRSQQIDYSYHGAGMSISAGYELPSQYRYIFPKRAVYGQVSYFKSLKPAWDFSVLNTSLTASTNIFSEKLGIETTLKYINAFGDYSPSAITGIDQDYEYNMPRDFRNTQTIRGVNKDVFGDKLYWGTFELKYILARNTNLKLLFIPINDLALNIFADGARIKNSELDLETDVYSYGSELSFGFNIVRFSAGIARGYIEDNALDAQLYGRISIKIEDLR